MCITCDISAKGREKIAITICILNSVIALFGIALIGMALYIKINIESRMMLLDGYDTDILPHFLLAVGINVVILHIVTFKIAYDCQNSETSGRCLNFLFLAVMLSFILAWFLLAGGLMCFTHRSVIEESLQNGLGYVMKQYKTDLTVKVTMDQLQQEYHCCGSNGYSDWFDINWVNEEFLNTKHPDVIRKLKGGLFYADDVPYSCCDVTSPRPCVHHAVKNKSMHVHYGSVTLYQSGCSGVLMDFFENRVLVPTGWSVISAFLLQFVTVVLMRYLQTSLADARDMEDPDGEGAGYCCPGCPCDCCSAEDPAKYIKRRETPTMEDVEEGFGGIGDVPDFGGFDGGNTDWDHPKEKNKKDKKSRSADKKDKSKTDKKKRSKDKKEKKVKDKSKDRKDKKSKRSGKKPSAKGSPKSKGSPKKKASPKAKRSPKKTSAKRSPKKTSAKRSPKKTSAKRSPKKRSPRRSPKKRSPKRSPKKRSPRRSPKKRSPRRSPKKMSPRRSPKKMSPRRSPKKMSPRRSLKKSPRKMKARRR